MAKKIICNLPNRTKDPETGAELKPETPNCTGVVAHQISPRMIQIGRQGKQRISVVGSNWSNMITCPACKREHTIICTNGVIDENGHHYEDIKPEENANPQGDPNNPNDPGQLPTHAAPSPNPAVGAQ